MGQVLSYQSNSSTNDDQTPQSIIDLDVLVLGAGNFGTCLADHLASIEKPELNRVTIWARDPNIVEGINNSHRNPKYLANIPLTNTLKATTELNAEIFQTQTAIVFAIPSQHMRSILKRVKPWIQPSHLLIFVNKGIEKGTLLLPNDIIKEELGPGIAANATFLSGPSFAAEVVSRKVTCVTVASSNLIRAKRAQALFHTPYFRVYDNNDVIGVESAGALKNVMALASGALTGMGLEQNARSAMITRALAEMTRIGMKLGANPLTFQGLSGVGDLFLTCTSEKSRNFTVGYRLGKGETLKHVLETLGSTAEGVETTVAAYELCKNLQVDAPIISGVYSVLYGGKNVKEVFNDITTRDPKSELIHV